MKFSLVVVTTDRLHLVERLFTSLSAQSYANFEIILVHGQACAARARSLVTEYAARLDIRTLISADMCLSRSRNAALPLINGDVVAFPDDDCAYTPNTLAQCAAVFAQHPHVHVLLARMADMEGTPAPSTNSPHKLHRLSLFRHSISFVQFHKRECVQAIGGFDESLGVGSAMPYQSGEDTDYLLRAFTAGFRILYAPSMLVRHPAVNIYDPALPAKARAYANGRMRLLRKHDFPWWFLAANVLYPLLRLPLDCLSACGRVVRWRCAMFTARLRALGEAQ